MKPQFLLDLSHTGIRLLHVAGGEEAELGSVRLDDPDFEQHVYDLYRTAEGRSKGRVRTTLLIPNSEVLYTRIDTGKGDREARGAMVAQALTGMTPYDLDDLVFDWRADGEEAVVAAVARETLEEAESFAVNHGFNPMAFSSQPANGAFRGRPNFGATKLAEARRGGAPWPDKPEPPPARTAVPADAGPTEPQATVEAAPEAAEASPEAPASVAVAAAQAAPAADSADQPKHELATEAAAEPVADAQGKPSDAEATPPSAEPVASPDAPDVSEPAPFFTLDDVPDPVFEPEVASVEAPVQEPVTMAEAAESAPAPAPSEDASKNAADAEKPASKPEDEAAAEKPQDVPADAATAAAPKPPTTEADSGTLKKKRGAGRASAEPPKKPAAAQKAAQGEDDSPDLDDVPPMPAFSSRRAAPSPAATPPERPTGLPALGSLPRGAKPPPPRPKIPPHLAKPVSGPGGKNAAATDAAKSSRLSSLMTRLQRIPDGGTPLEDTAPTLPPERPKPDAEAPTPSAQAAAAPKVTTVPMPPKKAPVPQDDLPRPRKGAAPKVTPIAGKVVPDKAAAASLVPPPRRAKTGTTIDTGPKLPDRGKLNEAESMTLFGARKHERKERSFAPVLIGIAVVLVLAIAVWTSVILLGSDSANTADGNALGLRDPVAEAGLTPSGPGVLPAIGPTAEAAAPPTVEPAESVAEDVATADAAPEALSDVTAEVAEPDAAEPTPEVEVAALAPAEEIAALAPAETIPDTVPAPPLSDSPLLAQPDEIADAPSIATAGDEVALAGSPAATAPPARDNSIGPQESAQPLPEPDTRDQAISRYAALGIWQLSPDPPVVPEGGRIDDLRLAALDPSLGFAAAPALGAVPERASLVPPVAPLPPAPAGTEFELDDQARVVATPAGALSPQGVRVTAGPPVSVPPARPDRPESLRDVVRVNPDDRPSLRPRQRPGDIDSQQDSVLVPESPEDVAPAAGPAVEDAPTPVPAAATSDFALRPVPRPETVARAASDLQSASGTLLASAAPAATTGEAAAALASTAGVLRVPSPPPRPARIASLAAAAADPAPAADNTAPAVAEALPAPEAPAVDEPLPDSPYAVIRSRKPASRPASLEREVAKARTATGPAVVQSATVRPTAPTRASVAKAATETNVLNLARLNLIGVYGGASDRRALVRLPSGRFVKVKVGDRIDGGRVASISEDELRYVKGGRNIKLEMPRG